MGWVERRLREKHGVESTRYVGGSWTSELRQKRDYEASWGKLLLGFIVSIPLAYGIFLIAVLLGVPFHH